ncbi:hypothetical protein ABH931_006127 [Streptacidiphilus sp. MAP12-33]|uniref:hypothetical protein n=1 Tax=Streptacidiphilus sp. MAP12-33 TaxID=3156266 RepID=UPI00351820C5
MTDQLPARMFNAVDLALGDGWWLPLTQRKNIADALYALVRPELEQLRRCVPLICSDERHLAKVAALEAEGGRAGAEALGNVIAYCEHMVQMGTEMGSHPQALAAYRDVVRAFAKEADRG